MTLTGLLAISALPAAAAVLTFDGDNCAAATTGIGPVTSCVSGGYLNQTYGDTATVNLTYSAGGLASNSLQRYRAVDNVAQFAYSDLTDVVFGLFGTSTSEITLTPLAGFSVTLNSLNLGTIPNTVPRDATVSVVDLATNSVVFTQAFNSGGGNQVGATAVLSSPGVSSTTGLRLVITTGDPSVIGIDNLSFDSAAVTAAPSVPEPSTVGLCGIGLAVLALVRRR